MTSTYMPESNLKRLTIRSDIELYITYDLSYEYNFSVNGSGPSEFIFPEQKNIDFGAEKISYLYIKRNYHSA